MAYLAPDILRRVRRQWLSLVLLGIATDLLLVVTLAVPASWGVRWLVGTHDSAVVSNTQLIGFLLSPAGLGIALLAWIVFAVTRFAQAAAGLSLVSGDKRRSWLAALRHVAFALPRLTKLAVIGLVLLGLGALPGLLVVAAAAYTVLTGEFDINYYLADRPSEFQTSLWVAIAGAILAGSGMLYVLMRTCLALPIVLDDGEPAIAAVRESIRQTKHRNWKLIRALLSFGVCAGLVFLVAAGVSTLVGWLASIAPAAWWGIGLVLLVFAVQLIASEAASVTIASLAAATLAVLHERLMPGHASHAPVAPPHWPALMTWRRGLLVYVAGFATIATIGGLTLAAAIQGISTEPPLVISHRGQTDDAPENSLLAFERALDAGADVVELDVQLSRDGVVVVVHDADLMRVAGVPDRVAQTSAARLTSQTLRGGDQTLPTLAEALKLIAPRGRVLIELKYYGFDDQLVPAVLKVVDEAGVRDRVMFMSLDRPAVQQTRELAPELPVGLTVATSLGKLGSIDADFIALGTRDASANAIADLHDAGLEVYVWTVNRPADLDRFLALGVDGVITDNTTAAKQAKEDQAGTTGIERVLLGLRVRLGV